VSDTYFPLLGDDRSDDLPRTLRRERDAREREAREREAQGRGATLPHDLRGRQPGFGAAPMVPAPATVMRFDVPFTHLVRFFLKSALAALPALFMLGTILWMAVTLVQTNYPALALGNRQAPTCQAASTEAPPVPLARLTANAPPPATEAKAAVRKRGTAERVKVGRN
jgi:hypothetical protein